jgi:dTDP-4-amino-4,6-dideoxygalactose transaminase
MSNTRFSSWPSFTAEEADAVQRVLLSNKVNYWTGTEVREFENEFASWCGTTYAIALANGTLALELALKALGVGPGDEVVVTPRTFIASISCVVNMGAIPVFADVEIDSGNISARTISKVLSARTRAIICVHLAGWPCDMEPIIALASKNNLMVIEDCAQAHGARYKGKSVGSIGHVGAWSFCQDKIITTGGEGGMVTTNDESLWRRMWSIKDHGKSYEAVYEREHPPGFRWLHDSFGSNYRMLEMQAAIGRIQLKKINTWTSVRKQNAERILDVCRQFKSLKVSQIHCINCPNTCRVHDDYCEHAYYKCYVYVQADYLFPGWDRDSIIDAINSEGVPCYQGSCSEVYLEKAFDGKVWRPQQRLAVAKELGEKSLMFLVHPTLTEFEIIKTCEAIKKVMTAASAKY